MAVDNSSLNNSEKLRLFFACWPDAGMQVQLAHLGRQLQQHTGGKPSRHENLHLTLIFLGDIASSRLPELQQLAGQLRLSEFDLLLQQLGGWLDAGIGWVKPEETPEPLQRLVAELKQGLTTAGFKVEKRRYQPHVTLLRKQSRHYVQRLPQPLLWPVKDFCLVASSLDHHGPSYQIIATWLLSPGSSD